MTSHDLDLSSLISSRICHDLISPLGAIGNGMELLQLTGTAMTPEMALIAESVANANAKVMFFRVAFGAASDGAMMGRAEMTTILGDLYAEGRVSVNLICPAEQIPRAEAKLLFLFLMCIESALPLGGTITVAADGTSLRVEAEAKRVKTEPELWEPLREIPKTALPPALVQFALTREHLLRLGRVLDLTLDNTHVRMSA